MYNKFLIINYTVTYTVNKCHYWFWTCGPRDTTVIEFFDCYQCCRELFWAEVGTTVFGRLQFLLDWKIVYATISQKYLKV